jgi:hypothetical protein
VAEKGGWQQSSRVNPGLKFAKIGKSNSVTTIWEKLNWLDLD